MGTCRIGISIVPVSGTTDFGNQKASHYILGFQWWSMIHWWITNACYSKQGSGELNISSRVLQNGSSGVEGVSKVLEIVRNVGRPGVYLCGLGGVDLIQQHYLCCNWARKQHSYNHLCCLIRPLNA
jgi:hypothetical protein